MSTVEPYSRKNFIVVPFLSPLQLTGLTPCLFLSGIYPYHEVKKRPVGPTWVIPTPRTGYHTQRTTIAPWRMSMSIARRTFCFVFLLFPVLILGGCARTDHVYLTWQDDPRTTMTVNFQSPAHYENLQLAYDNVSR